MYIFTPNTLIKSSEVNANFINISNLFDSLKVYSTYTSSALTFGINPAWAFYSIPDTEITITPTINVSALIDAYISINRNVNGSSEQDTQVTISINSGSFTDIVAAGGKGGPGVDDIAAPATLNYTKNIVKATISLTAGNSYRFRIAQGAGTVANVTVYSRFLRILTIPR